MDPARRVNFDEIKGICRGSGF